ncbi:hypothetical protein [Lysobacter sp. HA35]
MLFSRKAKLYRALDSLATYNDKGEAWAGHTPQQAEAHRTAALIHIRELAQALSPAALPAELRSAIESGELASDLTGRYSQLLKGGR